MSHLEKTLHKEHFVQFGAIALPALAIPEYRVSLDAKPALLVYIETPHALHEVCEQLSSDCPDTSNVFYLQQDLKRLTSLLLRRIDLSVPVQAIHYVVGACHKLTHAANIPVHSSAESDIDTLFTGVCQGAYSLDYAIGAMLGPQGVDDSEADWLAAYLQVEEVFRVLKLPADEFKHVCQTIPPERRHLVKEVNHG